jgi:hypothetical protein
MLIESRSWSNWERSSFIQLDSNAHLYNVLWVQESRRATCYRISILCVSTFFYTSMAWNYQGSCSESHDWIVKCWSNPVVGLIENAVRLYSLTRTPIYNVLWVQKSRSNSLCRIKFDCRPAINASLILSSQYWLAVTFLKLQSLLRVLRACRYSSSVSVGCCLRVARTWRAKISFLGFTKSACSVWMASSYSRQSSMYWKIEGETKLARTVNLWQYW